MLDQRDIQFLQDCINRAPMTGIQSSAMAVQTFQKLQAMQQEQANETPAEEVVSE